MSNNDPFELSKAKVPKLNTGFDTAQKIGGAIKRGARGASNAAHNKYSAKTTNMKPYVNRHTFGNLGHDQKLDRSVNRHASFIVGGTMGAIGGGVASIPVSAGGKKREGQIKAKQATIRANNKKIKEVNKALKVPKRPTLITDMGTAAGKAEHKEYSKLPRLRPLAFGAGVATGVTTTLGSASAKRGAQKTELARQDRRIANQNKKLSKKLDWSKTATDSDKRKYNAQSGASIAGTVIGGHMAGTAIGRQLGSAPTVGSAIGRGLRTKKGKIGSALAVGSLGGAVVAEHRGKKKGILVNKSDPFEISKDNQRYRKTKIAGGATAGYVGGALASGAIGQTKLAIPAAIGGAVAGGIYTKKKLGPKRAGGLSPVTAAPKGKKNNFATPVAKSAFGIDHGQ